MAVFTSPDDAEGSPWSAERLRQAMDSYHAEHERIRLDPKGRNLHHTHVNESQAEGLWIIQQVLVDPDEHCDWVVELDVDLEQSRARGEPVLRLRRIGAMT